MIAAEALYEIIGKATMGVFDAHEVGITGIESGAKEYAKRVAIDFGEWMQRYSLYDYSKHPYKYIVRQQPTSGRSKPEQFTAEQLFDLYLKSK